MKIYLVFVVYRNLVYLILPNTTEIIEFITFFQKTGFCRLAVVENGFDKNADFTSRRISTAHYAEAKAFSAC